MPDNNESDSEDNRVFTADPVTVDIEVGSPAIVFSSENIRQRLDKDDLVIALLLSATRVEKILSELLRKRYKITSSDFETLYGHQSLGSYLQTCNTLDLTESKHRDRLDDLVKARNKLAHSDGYIELIEEDDGERSEVRETIEGACRWIDSVQM